MVSAKTALVCVSPVGMANTAPWKVVQTVVLHTDSVALAPIRCGNAVVTMVGTDPIVAFC